jgi:hypothetical protein
MLSGFRLLAERAWYLPVLLAWLRSLYPFFIRLHRFWTFANEVKDFTYLTGMRAGTSCPLQISKRRRSLVAADPNL